MGKQSRSYAGQSAEDRTTARRERLVAATIEVLAAQGEARTTMTAICGAAALTERYFYESFRTRDEALVAALDSICNEIADSALSAIASATGDPAERVRAALRAFVSLMVSEPAKGRVTVIESSSNAALRARRHELLGWFADLVADEAAKLYADRAWPPERARLHGIVFIGGVSELIAAWLTDEAAVSPDQLVEIAADLFSAVARRP